jgi:7-carboxy-7-deazaguanine synthase
LRSLAEWMLADRVPARLQTQLHKHIWGAEARGV